MNPELDRALHAQHPKIFANRRLPESSCRTVDGLTNIGDGWYHLVDALCTILQRETDWNGAPQVVAIQLKEKLGGLRFYAQAASEHQHAMIETAMELSMHICKNCGAPEHHSHRENACRASCCNRPHG